MRELTQQSAPAFQKLFKLQAEKFQKKLVKVIKSGFSQLNLCLKEKDFTKGTEENNLVRVPMPLNKIGQVVGYGVGGPEVCRVLINQNVFHISAAYLKLAQKEDVDNGPDFNGSNP